MRLIGGHDYYDSAAGYGGYDNAAIFKRADDTPVPDGIPFQALRPDFPILSPTSVYGQPAWNKGFSGITIVVAGKIWSGLQYIGYDKNKNFVEAFFWNYSELINFFDGHEYFIQNKKTKKLVRFARIFSEDINPVDPAEYFVTDQDVSPPQMHWLTEHKVTILSALREGSGRGRKNFYQVDFPGLKKYGFPRLVDPFQMYQRIDQWVSGVLTGYGNPVVEIIDDKIKVEKHGFDKFSFRKQSGQT